MPNIELLEKAAGEGLHEFGALNTLLFVVILGMCIVCAYLIKEYRFYYLPESGAAMLVGMIVGVCARLFYPSRKEMEFLRFNKILFYFLLLLPIIFEAGYSVHRKRFFDNFNTILLYAVLGTVVSTFVIGYLTYYAGKLGWIDIDSSSPLESLLFGALISSVDPVATLSILGNPELNLDPLLYSLVFGESVLNDAVAIVLFNTFLKFEESQTEFTTSAVASLMVEFTLISLGSVACGVFTGLVCSFMCKNSNIKGYPAYEITLLFLYAYGSYALAEVMKLSGIMSLFFCGLIMAHYNSYNLSKPSQVTAEHIFKSFALVSEFFVFLWIANQGRSTKIPAKMQVVLWFAGLRGAISFALSQNMPGPNQDLYVTTTLSVCIFTTIICGGMTEPLLTYTRLKRDQPDPLEATDEEGEEELGLLDEIISDHDDDDDVRNHPVFARREEKSALHSFWSNIDEHYMKPVFGGSIHRRVSQPCPSPSSPPSKTSCLGKGLQ
ncbi:Sodium/hydrogen exchanger family [Phytophthora infestans]|uniref:Sodium/hydrogen exchanger family n=1 Tax=Phytophthora infestans TaxID=4787 RepID=A0A833SUD3_PHYIN|nr:Sodium/hydrogen exchanger family [Phytophthora infestans]KAF4131806.1 Sodium/hydrogen exchanger family [Phytophthora infestans]KAF4131817.1 Sodium/hydrogen exchanger family [Phytophthora infestans]